MSQAAPVRRIVILADGTGNAFSTQESNVWRLYKALDLAGPDQVARYIKGVGTSGFRPFAVLDGATGLGVPGNVRKLYRFLCWNWQPGVDIYVFGFSRGAFTARTLIGLVASQGLVPAAIDGQPVSRAAMRRAAMAAWRAYRAQSHPDGQVSPLITLVRWARNLMLGLLERLPGRRSHAVVRAATKAQGRDAVRIRFAGLFDTVEAYGVPMNELRRAIDFWIWPISFRNRVLSDKVDRARHALSLDDERTTFHPLRFDQGAEAPADPPRIKEVWFAGAHSDVGGGYPESGLSLVPLAWMMAEAVDAAPTPAEALRLADGALAGVLAASSPFTATHDSRAGLAVFYRYAPRPIDGGPANGGPPLVHHAVAEKMAFGTERYAPLTLPQFAHVLMPDGTRAAIQGFQPDRLRERPRASADRIAPTAAERAVAALSRPNAGYVEATRDAIWWRKAAYFVLFACALVALALPWTAPALGRLFTEGVAALARLAGRAGWAEQLQWRLANTQGGLSASLGDLSATLGGFVPRYASGWVQALVDQPLSGSAILAVTLLAWRWSGWLRDRVADLAHAAWFIDRDRPVPAPAPRPLDLRLAGRLRRSAAADGLVRLVAGGVVPGVALAAFGLGVVVLAERALVSYRSGSGAICRGNPPTATLRHPKPGEANRAEPFPVADPCWPTGLFLETGRTYVLWIEMIDPFMDGAAVVGLPGYQSADLAHLAGLPLRRFWSADWFQPIAKIGEGGVEWPLVSSEGVAAPTLPAAATLPGAWSAGSPCTPAAPSDPAAMADRQLRTGARRSFVSQFTAKGSGELFVFVNDVLGAVPYGPLLDCFYRNNRGTAAVTVELLPSPTPPPGQPYDFGRDR